MENRLPSLTVNPEVDAHEYLEQLRANCNRIAELTEVAPIDTMVPTCPDWSVHDLVTHLGTVHRWSAAALATGSPPPRAVSEVAEPRDQMMLAAWFRAGAEALLATLAATDPAAPTWHPFADEQVAAVWFRRQAHEAAIHRWDLEHALDAVTEIPAEMAADGIDEYLEIGIRRIIARDATTAPTGSLHLHCTDVHGEWLVRLDEDQLEMRREHAKGDAAVRGTAEAIWLRLLNRPVDDLAPLDILGDGAVAESWLSLPGL
jgi:uncharacterized protein (TIGR03083 family)